MATDENKAVKPKDTKITFKCSHCGKTRPFSEMVIVTRYFPFVVICRDCERSLR